MHLMLRNLVGYCNNICNLNVINPHFLIYISHFIFFDIFFDLSFDDNNLNNIFLITFNF